MRSLQTCQPLLFDCRSEAYKRPTGAAPVGTPVYFALTIPMDWGLVEPHLVLTKDGPAEMPVHYEMQYDGARDGNNCFSVSVPITTTGLYHYYFDLYTDFRCVYRGALGQGVLSWTGGEPWQLTVYEKDYATPEAFKGATMYQIFPDRFFEGRPHKKMPFPDRVYRLKKDREPYFWPNENGGQLNQDYFGGDFEGIRLKLPYLESLGVRYIYLNPIFEAHANHRYNTADYLKADPLLGTNEEFAALCAEAKKHGISIILDGVFSHTGSDSVYFNREGRYGKGGAYNDPKSPYREWYYFNSTYKCGYRSWWGFETLPEVRELNAAYMEFVCGKGGVIDTWLGLGAGGFRLDVADELPDEFIEMLRRAVKAHGEDKLLIGEVWEDATTKVAYGRRRTYLLGRGLDCVMNYPFRNAALDLARGKDMLQVAESVLAICDHYPKPALDCLMNFMSTHDTIRALTELVGEPINNRDRYWQSGRVVSGETYDRGVRLLLLCYAFVFTLPGVPSIYYGDEIAMQGYKDPFNRAYYNWDSTEERIRPVLARLAALRSECDAFKDGVFEVVKAEGDILHYRRRGQTQTAEIVINRGEHLVVEYPFGKAVEVNPCGFTIVVEDNIKERPGYFKIY